MNIRKVLIASGEIVLRSVLKALYFIADIIIQRHIFPIIVFIIFASESRYVMDYGNANISVTQRHIEEVMAPTFLTAGVICCLIVVAVSAVMMFSRWTIHQEEFMSMREKITLHQH